MQTCDLLLSSLWESLVLSVIHTPLCDPVELSGIEGLDHWAGYHELWWSVGWWLMMHHHHPSLLIKDSNSINGVA